MISTLSEQGEWEGFFKTCFNFKMCHFKTFYAIVAKFVDILQSFTGNIFMFDGYKMVDVKLSSKFIKHVAVFNQLLFLHRNEPKPANNRYDDVLILSFPAPCF